MELSGNTVHQSLQHVWKIIWKQQLNHGQLMSLSPGAGKTNIAVLTILRLIGQHMDAAGGDFWVDHGSHTTEQGDPKNGWITMIFIMAYI